MSLLSLPCRHPPCCRNETVCGGYASASTYWYTTSPGQDLHSPAPGLMGFQMPLYRVGRGWALGEAVIGYAGWDWSGMRTLTAPVNASTTTYYYRKELTVTSSACYTGMQLDFYATQVSGVGRTVTAISASVTVSVASRSGSDIVTCTSCHFMAFSLLTCGLTCWLLTTTGICFRVFSSSVPVWTLGMSLCI